MMGSHGMVGSSPSSRLAQHYGSALHFYCQKTSALSSLLDSQLQLYYIINTRYNSTNQLFLDVFFSVVRYLAEVSPPKSQTRLLHDYKVAPHDHQSPESSVTVTD